MTQSDGTHQPLEDYYKSFILSNPAWLSAKRVDPAGDLWRFSVPTGSRTGAKGMPKGTEHDVHIPASVACDLVSCSFLSRTPEGTLRRLRSGMRCTRVTIAASDAELAYAVHGTVTVYATSARRHEAVLD